MPADEGDAGGEKDDLGGWSVGRGSTAPGSRLAGEIGAEREAAHVVRDVEVAELVEAHLGRLEQLACDGDVHER